MKRIAIVLGAVLALFPNIRFLADFRYRTDPALERSVCRNVICSDELLLETANRFSEGTGEDAEVAVANRQEALRRNPASPTRWTDLGEALRASGRIEEARYCFKRAVELGPQSPPVFWRTALFYSEIKELSRSHEYMGRMLELVPEYRKLVFETYEASGSSIDDILEHGIPRQSTLAQEYFRYLLARDAALADIKKTWEWLNKHSLIDEYLAGDYTDFLLNKNQYAAAFEIWKNAMGAHDSSRSSSDLVFNGGFERDSIQSGLDWRFSGNQGARVNLDSTVVHSGSSSLRIEFDGGSNIDFNSVAHAVVAEPGRYRFSAWIKASDLTTDQGIGFRIVDSSGQVIDRTTPLNGTHDWTRVDLDFTLSPPVRLLRIEVVRQPSWKFDNKIRGKAWLDDVSLVRS
jgi:hypothetical protein